MQLQYNNYTDFNDTVLVYICNLLTYESTYIDVMTKNNCTLPAMTLYGENPGL